MKWKIMRTIVGWILIGRKFTKLELKTVVRICICVYVRLFVIFFFSYFLIIIFLFFSFILVFIYLFPFAASCHQKQKRLLHMSFGLIWMIFYLKRHSLWRLLNRIPYTHPYKTLSCTETQNMFKDFHFSFLLKIFASSFYTQE